MENQKYRHDDEVSLKEIILIIIHYWKVVLGSAGFFVLIAMLYLFIIAKPVYESTVDGIIAIPEEVETRYGTYPFPTQNPKDYLDLVFSDRIIRKLIHNNTLDESISEFRENIRMEQEVEASRFVFYLKSDTPENGKKLLEELSNLYLQEAVYQSKLAALGYFQTMHHINLNKISIERDTISKTIKEYEKLLQETERTLPLKKLVLTDPVYASKIADEKNIDIKNLSDVMMVEEYVNPNYEALELQIIDLKKNYATLDVEEAKLQKYINEIQSERTMVSKYLLGGSDAVMVEGLLEVLKPHINISEEATLPEEPISPKRKIVLIISLILGTLMGIFIALFKAYWKSESEKLNRN